MDAGELKERTKRFAVRVLAVVDALLEEANEIVSIMTASRKTAQQRLNRQSAIGNRQ